LTRKLERCKADEQLLNELRKGNGEDKEVRDGSDLEASSSSEALAQAGHHTRSKSKGRGEVRQTLSLGKRVVGSRITGAGLVVKKRQVLGTKKASLTRNFKVSKNALLVNKNLLKGQKLLRHFPGFGNYYGTVKRFNLERNTYTLKFKDGYTEETAFEDAMKLIPKSWWAKEAYTVAMAECRSMLEVLATACALSVECVDTNYTEPTDWNAMLKAPDVEKWLAAVKLEFETLVKMGCWEVVDIPIDTPFLGVRWVYKIKRIQSVYERHKARLVVKGITGEKDSL
jgi:hypothetical protein